MGGQAHFINSFRYNSMGGFFLSTLSACPPILLQAHFINSFRQGGDMNLGVLGQVSQKSPESPLKEPYIDPLGVLGQFLNAWDSTVGSTSHGGW